MKIKELIDALSAFDPENDVLCYCEEENISAPNHCSFRLFDIENIDVSDAEMIKDNNYIPSLKFGKTKHSIPHVLINIVSDF